MLHCGDRSFYVGHTENLEKRMSEHHSGKYPGYTHSRRPVTLVWSEYFQTRIDALNVERQIKGWSRAKKPALIRGDWPLISALAHSGKEEEMPSTSSGQTDGGGYAL
ncbi:MAG: GIY-YIG nuclease family protein [Chakrabartia sp.]